MYLSIINLHIPQIQSMMSPVGGGGGGDGGLYAYCLGAFYEIRTRTNARARREIWMSARASFFSASLSLPSSLFPKIRSSSLLLLSLLLGHLSIIDSEIRNTSYVWGRGRAFITYSLGLSFSSIFIFGPKIIFKMKRENSSLVLLYYKFYKILKCKIGYGIVYVCLTKNSPICMARFSKNLPKHFISYLVFYSNLTIALEFVIIS